MAKPVMTTSHAAGSSWSGKRFLVFVIIASVILVSSAGYGFLLLQKRFLLADKNRELSTIADLKTSQILQWRKERFIEAALIRSNDMMSRRIHDYISGKDKALVLEEFRSWMTSLNDLSDYRSGTLFSTDGDIIIAVKDVRGMPPNHYLAMVQEAAREQELILSDLHLNESSGTVDINLVIPILYSEEGQSRCIAVLALDIDPYKELYPIIQSWPTSSKSAESLLVRRDGEDVLFLNELRYLKNTALRFRRPLASRTMPAVRAVLGEEGVFEGTDYRGVSVVSATRSIPGTTWALVAKLDSDELFAPISKSIWYVATFCIVLVAALWFGSFLWLSRKSEAFLREQFKTEQAYSNELKQAEEYLLEARASLAQRVRERTEELTASNNMLKQEIVERKQLEGRLVEAKKLESIGQIAGGVAHEVRNPLNAILTITEALFREKEIESNPEYEPYINHIRTQVNRLAQLMNDLLDLGRIIPDHSLHPVPLFELCRETLEVWKTSGMSDNKQGVLTADNQIESLLVKADAQKLQQVIFNLLENAGHHSPCSEAVQVHLAADYHGEVSEGMAIIRVIDQGKGIPADKVNRVFDPFYSDRKGGTGLGLTLVKHIVENMGGTVEIWNNNPPPGCTAEVRIPLADKEQHGN